MKENIKIRSMRKREDFLILIALLVAAILPLSEALFVPGKLIYANDIALFYSLDLPGRMALQHGELPLWDPWVGAGNPGLGDPQTATFYLPAMLLRFLPVVTAFNLGGILHLWVSGLGIYVLLHDLGARRAPSLLSAISYMLSIAPRIYAGHVILIYAAAWPAWILWSYTRLLLSHRIVYFILTVVFVALLVLTGHIPFVMVALTIPAGFFVYFLITILRTKDFGQLGWGTAASVLIAISAGGLVAIQLLPTIEWFGQVARGTGLQFLYANYAYLDLPQVPLMLVPYLWLDPYTLTSLGFMPENWWELFPYAGLITLVLALYAPFARDSSIRKVSHFFVALAAFALAISLKGSPLFKLVFGVFPYIRIPGRFMFLWVFSIAVLGGLGLEGLIRLMEHQQPQLPAVFRVTKYLIIGLAAASTILLILWVIMGDRIMEEQRALGRFYWIPSGMFAAAQRYNLLILALTLCSIAALWVLINRRLVSVSVAAWLCVGLVFSEMLIFAVHMVRPYSASLLYNPDAPEARLHLSMAEIRLPDKSRLPSNYGISSFGLRGDGSDLELLKGLMALNDTSVRGAQLLSARYLVSEEPIIRPDLREVRHVKDAYLYEYQDNWPRIYAAPTYELVATDDEAFNLVSKLRFDYTRIAVITGTHGLDLPQSTGEQVDFTGSFTEYRQNSFSAHVTASRPVVVVFSETYYPGWKAWVDGKPVQIWQANYAFRGVVVPEGEHIIKMEYYPASFDLGWKIGAATLAMLMIGAGVHIVRRQYGLLQTTAESGL